MKIAFVNQPWNPIVPPIQSGSIAIWTEQVARRLVKRGFEVVLYGTRDHADRSVEVYEGVEYRRIPTRPDRLAAKLLKRMPFAGPAASAGWYYQGYIAGVAMDLKRNPADIVHIHNLSQFVPPVKELNPRARVALHMHFGWLGGSEHRLLTHRLNKANLILGCSEYISDIARQRFPQLADRCLTVYNGVDEQQFVPLANGRSKTGQKVLFVGRVSPEKGLHVLLEAFKDVRQQHPQAELEIVGPNSMTPIDFLTGGESREELSKLRAFYGGSSYLDQLKAQASDLDGVTFTPAVPHGLLPRSYQSADILVNPSLSEAFGMSLIEAMACGIPTVASWAGGMREVVVHEETGILVEPGNACSLAGALNELLENPDDRLAMGQAGRQRVLEQFAWERVVDQLLAAYEQALPPTPSSDSAGEPAGSQREKG